MRFAPKEPPRIFMVGNGEPFAMHDCGSIYLEADEQVTFHTASSAEYDIARKDWGFYATPSINGRLSSFGLQAVLVRNPLGRFFIMLVEKGSEESFRRYAESEANEIICWLDEDNLERITAFFQGKGR